MPSRRSISAVEANSDTAAAAPSEPGRPDGYEALATCLVPDDWAPAPVDEAQLRELGIALRGQRRPPQ